MAVQTGKNGQISIGATPIAQTRSWSLETTADPIEHSVIGNEWREFLTTMSGWSCTVEGYYDVSDTGAAALNLGSEVAVELQPAGGTSGEKQYDGNAVVTAYNETAAFDGMVEFTATLQGTGALVESTVP